MPRARRPLLAAAIALNSLTTFAVAVGAPSWAAHRPRAATLCATFHVVSAPPVAGGNVASIDATSPTDVWAVGLGRPQPTILHWDGRRWSVARQDGAKGTGTAVTAISPNDAWMVGENGSLPISKHWDGAMWRSVIVPMVGTDDTLTSVTALSSSDVWAAGKYTDGAIHPLVMHWDGSAWTQVPAPDGVPNSTNFFYGISAVDSEDIWAVGYEDVSFLHFQPLIEHWDGASWTVVPSPVFLGNDNILYDVSARASDDVWAVGKQGDSGTELRTLAERWDGTSWSVVFTPDVGMLGALSGVDTVSTADAWAVGSFGTPEAVLVEHWDGTNWTIVKSPPKDDGAFGGIRAISPTEIWAVGGVFDPNIADLRPLTMRSKGCQPD
jgi:hypothetical protein